MLPNRLRQQTRVHLLHAFTDLHPNQLAGKEQLLDHRALAKRSRSTSLKAYNRHRLRNLGKNT